MYSLKEDTYIFTIQIPKNITRFTINVVNQSASLFSKVNLVNSILEHILFRGLPSI